MIIFFQNILFWKNCLAYIDCFGLFTKIKKVFGTSFWSTFSAYYCHENVPFYQMTKFKCQTYFPSQDIKQCVFKFLFGQLMTSKLYLYILNHLLKKALTGRIKKEGKIGKHKNLNILRRKRFLDEIKNIFHIFLGAIIW